MRTGTLEECMGKVFTLYMENRIKDVSVERYLFLLRDEKAEQIFSQEDVNHLLGLLRKDKEESERYVAEPRPKDYMIDYIENARTVNDLDGFENAVLSLRDGFGETQAIEEVLVQTKRLDAIQKRREKENDSKTSKCLSSMRAKKGSKHVRDMCGLLDKI